MSDWCRYFSFPVLYNGRSADKENTAFRRRQSFWSTGPKKKKTQRFEEGKQATCSRHCSVSTWTLGVHTCQHRDFTKREGRGEIWEYEEKMSFLEAGSSVFRAHMFAWCICINIWMEAVGFKSWTAHRYFVRNRFGGIIINWEKYGRKWEIGRTTWGRRERALKISSLPLKRVGKYAGRWGTKAHMLLQLITKGVFRNNVTQIFGITLNWNYDSEKIHVNFPFNPWSEKCYG